MTDDVFPHPDRAEPRGEFPEHLPHPGFQVLSGPDALADARKRLADWVAAHREACDG